MGVIVRGVLRWRDLAEPACRMSPDVEGYLAHERMQPPRTLQEDDAHGELFGGAPLQDQLVECRLMNRGTSLIRNNPPVGPYSGPMPGNLW